MTPERLSSPEQAWLLGAALFDRRCFDQVGGFDETLRVGDDFDWFMRARRAGQSPVASPERVVLIKFWHRDNLSRRTDLHIRDVLQIARKGIAAARAVSAAP